MQTLFFINLLQQPFFIILICTFLGAFIGELFRKKTSMKLFKFISTFLASWWLALAIMCILISLIAALKNNKYMIMGLSGGLGYLGQEKSKDFLLKILNSGLDLLLNIKNKNLDNNSK